MEKNIPIHLQEIIFSSSDSATSQQISKLEKEGTMTNSERRVSYLPKQIEAPGEARPDVEIFCDFAQRMGFRGFNYNGADEIYAEYASMTKGTNIDVSFLNYDRLKNVM